jgi:DNA polymerase elongation subunit (family B)
LHSVNRNEVYVETEKTKRKDIDVQSYYPAILVENGYYPHHLGLPILNEYAKMYHKRVQLKPLAKKDKKIKGIVDGLKLALNAVFGKMGSAESWLYDKQALLSVTLTGQFCLLMLIEELELNGFHVFSANTDGVTSSVDIDKIAEFERIKKEWEEKNTFLA